MNLGYLVADTVEAFATKLEAISDEFQRIATTPG